MADTNVVLSSLRDELATVDRRRAELRGELEGLDREHDRLATTISVLTERVGAPGSDPPDSSESVPLADRIVDALGTTGLRRPEMLRIFTAQGFTASAIDSAVNRLKRRGLIRRHGKRVLSAEPRSGMAEPVASLRRLPAFRSPMPGRRRISHPSVNLVISPPLAAFPVRLTPLGFPMAALTTLTSAL